MDDVTETLDSLSDHADSAQDDWLGSCVGFVVEAGGEPIGSVAGVQRDAERGRPIALVVRGGLARRSRFVVLVDEVAGVALGSRRIVLNDVPRTGREDDGRRPVEWVAPRVTT
jgi:hypothetical protein